MATVNIELLDELFAPTAFNSRFSTDAQLAATFVAPAFFEDLLRPEHTVLLGSRGTGKTTLLRMIQEECLRLWRDERAERLLDELQFSAIHIPSDYHWVEEWRSFEGPDGSAGFSAALRAASFTIHVQKCLLRSIRYRLSGGRSAVGSCRFPIEISADDASAMIRRIADAWAIETPCSTVDDLLASLHVRARKLREARDRVFYFPDDLAVAKARVDDFVFQGWEEAVYSAVDIVNNATDRPNHRWALLFDELESAPPELRKALVRLMRVGDGKILLKLSLLPLMNELEVNEPELDPSPEQDYEVIPLNEARVRRSGSQDFALDMVRSLLRHKGILDDPRAVFQSAHGQAPGDHTDILSIAEALAEVDAHFYMFLKSNGIDPKRLRAADRRDPAIKLLEKLSSLLRMRLWLAAHDKRPSHWSYVAYSGIDNVLAVLEGNPRRISLFCRMATAGRSAQDGPVVISPETQGQVLALIGKRSGDLLQAAIADVSSNVTDWKPLMSLMQRLGDYLRDRLLSGPIQPDGPGYFVCDAADLSRLVRLGVNAGVFVVVPEDGGEHTAHLNSDMMGSSFRLSFLTYPQYRLPLRLGGSISVTSALAGQQDQYVLEIR